MDEENNLEGRSPDYCQGYFAGIKKGGIKMDEKLKEEIIELMRQFDNKDSIEIGNAKSGTIKIYGDFSKPEEIKKKVLSAVEILKEQRRSVFE